MVNRLNNQAVFLYPKRGDKMDKLTIEQYREYLVKRIKRLTELIEQFEKIGNECLTKNEVDWFLRAYAALDDIMERLFIIDNTQDAEE